MKSEHYKLMRDLFHALSVGALGVALFPSDATVEYRLAAIVGGFYAHLLAHAAILYDRKHRVSLLIRERRDERKAREVEP